MGTTHIVTVGTRGSDNFGASAVTGNGPWTVWIGDPWNLDDTVVGDVMRDFFGRIYLITDMASDASWLKVRDINAAGGAAPYAGVGLLADGRTDRAYSGIGNAEMDIPDIVGPADDTWECHVYNDGMIFESTVWIDDQSLSQLGTIKITVPESERHTGKGGTGPVWAGTLPGFEFIFSYPSGPAGAPAHQLFEWLEIVAAFGGTLAVGVYIVHSGQSTVLRNLLVHQQVPDTSAYGIVIAAPDVDLINCAVFEVRTFSPSTAIGLLCFNSTGRTRVMNCTFDFCTSSAIN